MSCSNELCVALAEIAREAHTRVAYIMLLAEEEEPPHEGPSAGWLALADRVRKLGKAIDSWEEGKA